MGLPGGGPWELGPGQVTDDSELAMCLMWGLVEGNEESKEDENIMPTASIAKYYSKWMNSPPFDIGTTTINGIGKLKHDAKP